MNAIRARFQWITAQCKKTGNLTARRNGQNCRNASDLLTLATNYSCCETIFPLWRKNRVSIEVGENSLRQPHQRLNLKRKRFRDSHLVQQHVVNRFDPFGGSPPVSTGSFSIRSLSFQKVDCRRSMTPLAKSRVTRPSFVVTRRGKLVGRRRDRDSRFRLLCMQMRPSRRTLWSAE